MVRYSNYDIMIYTARVNCEADPQTDWKTRSSGNLNRIVFMYEYRRLGGSAEDGNYRSIQTVFFGQLHNQVSLLPSTCPNANRGQLTMHMLACFKPTKNNDKQRKTKHSQR